MRFTKRKVGQIQSFSLEQTNVDFILGEKSPALARSFSMDSISPNTSAPSVSHQPSSLSLNNADDFKDLNGKDSRKICSNPELEVILTKVEKSEPEAVLVEIEEDNFPEIEMGPGAGFDQNKHE